MPPMRFAALFGLMIVAPPARAIELADGALGVNAFADVEYARSTFGAVGASQGFRSHHANLLVTGRPAPELVLHLNVEWENGGTAAPGTFGGGKTEVEAAYVEWNPATWARIRAGRFMTPYGCYGELRDTTPTYPGVHIPDALYRTRTYSPRAWDVMPKLTSGLAFMADAGTFRATAFVGNGFTDGNDAFTDDNLDPAVGVRLETDPSGEVSANLTGFHSALGPDASEGHAFSGVAGLVAGAGRVGALAEAFVETREGSVQCGGFVEATSDHIPRTTTFVRGEVFSAAGVGWEAVVGARVDVVSGYAFVKIEHAVLAEVGVPESGELRLAVVGWF